MSDGKVRILFQSNAKEASYDMEKLDKSLKSIKGSGKDVVNNNAMLSNSMNKLKTAVTGLVGAYVGLRGIQMIGNYAIQATEAFRTQERAIGSLNLALQNAGVYSAQYSREIQNLASEIQSYSNYGDEAIIQAQALGQAYIGNIAITKELTKAVVDFASAQNMDLDSAFKLVGKSIGSSTNALGRYGIQLEKGLTDQQKMAVITQELSNRFGGQAKAMANASTQLKNAIGDLNEAFGGVLDGYVRRWQNGMTLMVRATTNFINSIRSMRKEITSSNDIAELEKKYWKNAKEINAYMASPVQSMKGLERKSRLQAENNLILQQIKYIRDLEKQASKKPVYKMTDDEASLGSLANIGTATAGTTAKVKEVKDAYEQLQASVANAKRQIELNAIAYGTSSTQVQQSFEAYRQLNTQLSQIDALFNENTTKVIEQKGAYEQLQQKLIDLRTALYDLGAAGDTSSQTFENMRTEYFETANQINEINNSLTQEMGKNWDNASKSISQSLSGTLVNALRSGGNAFESFGNLAVSVLERITSKLIEMAIVSPIINAFTGGFGGSLLSFLGFKDGGVFQNGVQKFANGGVVNKPTLFPMASGAGLMGEAGPEAIMPLKRTSSGDLGVQATSPTINIYNQSGSEIETRRRPNGDIDLFIKKVNEALANERTNSGFSKAYQRQASYGVQAV